MKLSNQRITSIILPLTVVFIIILFRIFGFFGHYGFDDMEYARMASDLLKGTPDFSNHYLFRTMLVVPLAVCYKIWGFNDYASSVPSLLAFIGIIFIVYKIVKTQPFGIQLISYSLIVFNPWTLFYSDKIMPDTLITTSFLWIVYLFYSHRIKNRFEKPLYYGTLTAIAIIFSLLIKESIILLIPFFLYFFIFDLLHKKNYRYWISLLTSTILFFSIYLIIIKIVTGSYFQRFAALENGMYYSSCSYSELPFRQTLLRITIDFWRMLIDHSMITSIVFLLAFFNFKFLIKPDENEKHFFYTASILVLISAEFMSVSYKGYNPLCIDPRHYLFLIPIASIAISKDLYNTFSTKSKIFHLIAAWSILFLVMFYDNRKLYYTNYLLFLIPIILTWIVPLKKHSVLFICYIFAAINIYITLPTIKLGQQSHFEQQQLAVQQIVSSISPDKLIITDPAQIRFSRYYSGFDSTKNKFQNILEYNNDTIPDTTAFFLFNPHTLGLSAISNSAFPEWIEYQVLLDKPLAETFGCKLFQIDNFPSSIKLISDTYDAEDTCRYWSYDKKTETDIQKFEGKYSNKVHEYSATFEYKLSSPYDTTKIYMIKTQSYYFSSQLVDAVIVLSTDGVKQTSQWHSDPLQNNNSVFNKWTERNTKRFLKLDLKSGDTTKLKVYIYNPTHKELFIDNFSVKIFEMLVK